MSIDLNDIESKASEAVKAFWGNREAAKQKQIELGKADQGDRSSVTAGKNMDGFRTIIIDLVKKNGLSDATISQKKSLITLPGYFRPTKEWDLLVTYKKELIAAIELKSHVGSFGNNFNNRAEEVIGSGVDLWTAYREQAFGEQPSPFVGWLMMVEDAPNSRRPIRMTSRHFPVFEDFKGASYIKRYDILCQKLMYEKIYTAASVIASPRSAIETGEYSEESSMTALMTFASYLAGHVSAAAQRLV